MSYDEYRLWKHKQKRTQKHREMTAKLDQEGQLRRRKKYPQEYDHQEEEPDFATYAEYQEWKKQHKPEQPPKAEEEDHDKLFQHKQRSSKRKSRSEKQPV